MIVALLEADPLSEAAEDVLRTLWPHGGLPVRFTALEDAAVGWREGGGPPAHTARRIINGALAKLAGALAETPLHIHRVHAAWRLTIGV